MDLSVIIYGKHIPIQRHKTYEYPVGIKDKDNRPSGSIAILNKDIEKHFTSYRHFVDVVLENSTADISISPTGSTSPIKTYGSAKILNLDRWMNYSYGDTVIIVFT